MFQTSVADGVHRIEHAYTNLYLVQDGDALTIVDAGVPPAWDLLVDAVRTLGRDLSDIAAVVLTHAHFDHLGFAERARTQLGVPVWVHENDVPLTRKPLLYTRLRSPLRYYAENPSALPILGALARTRAFFPPPVRDVRRFRDGTLDVPGSPRVVPTPGHTIGHCALHLADRDTVIAGDAVVTLDPYTGRRGPRIVARAATGDPERAVASLDALAATGARTVLCGHGEPWGEGAEAAAERARSAGVD
jgi:glyoxylase-like metal-dependent hydrolase (beta-lactamase superfamily II)